MRYLILRNPGHNRVYFDNSEKLAAAELKIVCKPFLTDPPKVESVDIGGVRYLAFETEEPIIDKAGSAAPFLKTLSRLSFAYAIFELTKINGKTFLKPIAKPKVDFLDERITTILKYKGKTNEIFTKALVNLAAAASDFDFSDRLRLLDPVAGKGTTLFEALSRGFDAYGIEIESKLSHEGAVFFRQYLESERFKRSFAKRKIAGDKKSNAVHIQEFEFARTKEEHKSGETRRIGFAHGDARKAAEYFPKNNFHLIVGDLPYGIFHGSSGKKKSGVSRNPSELLASCLPAWRRVLKPGGAVALAWNSFLVSRGELASIFEKNDFEVLSGGAFEELEHKVDRSIKRDVLVAR